MPDMPNKTTYDISTGETTVEPLTQEEVNEINAAEATANAAREASNSVRESALAKLAALGLTEEEIAAIIGG
jgi:DNA-binding NarL/FixJ family response regulator